MMPTTKTDLLERIADYVRLEIDAGTIRVNTPVAIAWRDYARFVLQGETGYYAGVLNHSLNLFPYEDEP